MSISFFIALFGCSFAHGQQEEDNTTSIPAFGKLTQPMSTPTLILTSFYPPIPPATTNIAQEQEQIIGGDLVVPSPNLSLPMDGVLNDMQRFQLQAGEERNNHEDARSDTNDDEAPLDLKLPVPFP